MNKEKNIFHFEYVTKDDIQNETQKLISELSEESISKFIFRGESFYCIGSGHCFARGFYTEYITKSGIRATQYVSGYWEILEDDYELINEEFKIIPKTETQPINWDEITFPIIKNTNSKTIASELTSLKNEEYIR